MHPPNKKWNLQFLECCGIHIVPLLDCAANRFLRPFSRGESRLAPATRPSRASLVAEYSDACVVGNEKTAGQRYAPERY